MSDTLVAIPSFLRAPPDLEQTVRTLESVRATEPEVDVLVVDDGSPAHELVDELDGHRERLQFELDARDENRGFSAAVNVGLRRARDNHQNAVLLNADVEIETADWVKAMVETPDSRGRPAAVVGALLLFPGVPGERLIQHGGVFASLLTRTWDHRFRFAPETLPEAHVAWRCPVTAAFQFIRVGCLERVGIYSEKYRMSYEDVAYCLSVFDLGFECVYNPAIIAVHHESMFRKRADKKLVAWQADSYAQLQSEHGKRNLAEFIPEIA